MRTETKLGLIVPLVAVAVGAIWWFSQPTNELPELSIDKSTMDATVADDTALAADSPTTFSDPPAAVRISPPRSTGEPLTPAPSRRPTRVQPGPVEADSATDGPLVGPPSGGELGEDTSTEVVSDPPAQESDLSTPPDAPDPATSEDADADQPKTPAAADAPLRRGHTATPPAEHPRLRLGERGSPGTKTHMIQPGDRLIDIAQDEYGDGTLWRAIKAVNPEIDENSLQVGTTIKIPSRDEASKLAQSATASTADAPRTTRAPADTAAAIPTSAGRATYAVERGDSLITIARNVLEDAARWEEIYELNRDQLESPHLLRIGMKLRLPPLSE